MRYSANRRSRYARRGALLTAACALTTCEASATPVSTIFQINQSSSSLEATVQRGSLSDADSNPLSGTINATFDFGATGALPTTAGVTVTSADVRPVGDYNFGLPRLFPLVRINASGLVADVSTPAPPGTMTKPPGPGSTYQFDSSQFTITMVEGVITVTGLFNDSVDLAEEEPPIAGASPPGTIGTLAFTNAGTSGFYTRLNATLNLPIFIDQTVMFGDPPNVEEVDLTLDATVVASASFYVALAGIPGDFNQDQSVNDADLPLWKAGFGKATGATVTDGDANADGDSDGADFLVWQQNYGTAPPQIVGAASVPEPTTAALIACGLAPLAARARRRQSAQPR